MKCEESLKPYVIEFAKGSFRDLADRDYILARICHRYALDQQFLWNSLQAMEKYFKAILLFNGKSTKNIGHDLVKGLNKVEEIPDISFQVPDDVRQFIEYINEFGSDWYLIKPFHLRDYSLLALDKTIWHIRRYFYYLRAKIKRHDGSERDLLLFEIQKLKN